MEPSDRRAFERRVISRALKHEIVLVGSVVGGKIGFRWRLTRKQLGPEFTTRDLAIDWMAQRLAEADGSDRPK
jgi:hypothetical protein